jgi:hypothetical protein
MSNKSSLQINPQQLKPGDIDLGRYVIEREFLEDQETKKPLRSGQRVFKAKDTIFDINVVMVYLLDTEYHDIFTKTGQSMTKLSLHENIASVFECKSMTDYSVIIREFIEGSNAEFYFDENKNRGENRCNTPVDKKMEKTLVMGVNISSALSYLFKEGINCSDIMLSNILITHEGTFKLADVGLMCKKILTEDEALQQFCKVIQEAFNCIERKYENERKDLSPSWTEYLKNSSPSWTEYLSNIESLSNIRSFEDLKQISEKLKQEVEKEKKVKLDTLVMRAFKPVEIEVNRYTSLKVICEEAKSHDKKIETKLDNLLKTIEKEENPSLDSIKSTVVEIREDKKDESDRRKKSLDDFLEKIKKEAKTIEEDSPLDLIKNIIRKNTEESVQRIVESLYNYPGLTILNNEEPWYPTILMRRPEVQEPNRVMGDYFVPVFYGQYKESHRVAAGGWEKGEVEAIKISKSCAGLPIVLHSGKINEIDEDTTPFLVCKSDVNDFVEYCTLTDLQKALKKSKYIENIYRTPKSIGIPLESEAGKCPEMKEIAAKIKTEIVVPIYGSLQKDYQGKASNIIGVVNFEFEQKLETSEAELIGKILNSIVKNESYLPNEIVCDLLSITPFKNVIIEDSNEIMKTSSRTSEKFISNSFDGFKHTSDIA